MKPRAFVIMPFDEEFDNIYDYLIRDPLSEMGYDVKRADDLHNQQNIMEDILRSIIDSELIVADLSKANPNVYYELGLAHSYGRRVILLAQDIDEVPFDLRSYRIITYSNHFTKMNEAQEELKKLIEGVQAGSVKFGSPVTDFGLPFPDLSTLETQPQAVSDDNQDDRGLLDYQIEFHESTEILTEVIGGVGKRLNPLTVDLEGATDQLVIHKGAPGRQRKIMREMAVKLDKFTLWLRKGNGQYRQALGDMGQSANGMLSAEFELSDEDKDSLVKLLQEIDTVQEAMQEAHYSFSELVTNMDAFPKIEKEFHRAKRNMATELKTFIDNIEQTEAVIIRVQKLAQRLLNLS